MALAALCARLPAAAAGRGLQGFGLNGTADTDGNRMRMQPAARSGETRAARAQLVALGYELAVLDRLWRRNASQQGSGKIGTTVGSLRRKGSNTAAAVAACCGCGCLLVGWSRDVGAFAGSFSAENGAAVGWKLERMRAWALCAMLRALEDSAKACVNPLGSQLAHTFFMPVCLTLLAACARISTAANNVRSFLLRRFVFADSPPGGESGTLFDVRNEHFQVQKTQDKKREEMFSLRDVFAGTALAGHAHGGACPQPIPAVDAAFELAALHSVLGAVPRFSVGLRGGQFHHQQTQQQTKHRRGRRRVRDTDPDVSNKSHEQARDAKHADSRLVQAVYPPVVRPNSFGIGRRSEPHMLTMKDHKQPQQQRERAHEQLHAHQQEQEQQQQQEQQQSEQQQQRQQQQQQQQQRQQKRKSITSESSSAPSETSIINADICASKEGAPGYMFENKHQHGSARSSQLNYDRNSGFVQTPKTPISNIDDIFAVLGGKKSKKDRKRRNEVRSKGEHKTKRSKH